MNAKQFSKAKATNTNNPPIHTTNQPTTTAAAAAAIKPTPSNQTDGNQRLHLPQRDPSGSHPVLHGGD
jgi:hypothetical protein